jgi:GTP diphosphokinase / guanosine-3',5'-bis(diphosphate) 3'-diphosphatase
MGIIPNYIYTPVELEQIQQWKTELFDKITTYIKDKKQLDIIDQAFVLATKQHQGQFRIKGGVYIEHPICVAGILTEYKIDYCALVSALLHDVVEDTDYQLEQIEKQFGAEISAIVDGLTKISHVSFRSVEEKFAENFRKMLISMSKDLRVVIVKLADRTHNMQTLASLSDEKKHRIAFETLEVYAPLAGRLGMFNLKAQLEDISLRYLKPDVYANIKQLVSKKQVERQDILQSTLQNLETELKSLQIQYEIQGRYKHFYSIYRKMVDRKIGFDDIRDLFAVRILVSSVAQCYEVLGFIHNTYLMIPGKFKDYIALPKTNMYQSLHTSVYMKEGGEILEVQIRTFEMHQFAEFGVAAHWAYKDNRKGVSHSANNLDKFNFLKQLVSKQENNRDFIDSVRSDFFEDKIFVFSPKGDVSELPTGATPIDFGFGIHSKLGLHITGAKVNGKMVPISTTLQSGDVVELLVSQNKVTAKLEWLEFVVSSKAKGKIRAHLRLEEREEQIEEGREIFKKALNEYDFTLDKLEKTGFLHDVNTVVDCSNFLDMLVQIALGKLQADACARSIINAVHPNYFHDIDKKEANKTELEKITERHIEKKGDKTLELLNSKKNITHGTLSHTKDGKGILVSGLKGVDVVMAKCCQPIHGQRVFGVISAHKGIVIHASNCEQGLRSQPERWIECKWDGADVQGDSMVELKVIYQQDVPGLLNVLTQTFADLNINISSLASFENISKQRIIQLSFPVQSITALSSIFQKIESLPLVLHVERLHI